MSLHPTVQYASRTDKGMRRAMNQDSLQIRIGSDPEEWSRCGYLFMVADGMGGHAVGDLASRIAVETLPQAYFRGNAENVEARLRSAVLEANRAINDRGRRNIEFSGMGTTCSTLTLSENGAIVGHVGDSRIYRIRGEQIEQLTFDHSLQWEMIRLGRATPETVELFHPRNVITRCLGPDPVVQVDIEGPFSVQSGDFFLLCSDGLTNHVSDSEIGQIVSSLPPAESTRLLINLANCRGGSDNSTVIVVQIESYPSAASRADIPEVLIPLERKTAELMPVRIPGIQPVLLAGASVLCLLAGLWLGTSGKPAAAAVLIAASAVAWLISRRLSGRKFSETTPPEQATVTESPGKNEAEAESENLPPSVDSPADAGSADLSSDVRHVSGVPDYRSTSDSQSLSRSAFHPTSPYRVVSARLTELLLSSLSEVQSQLVHAARDSGWKVDFDEITSLSRQAVQALQGKHLDKAMKYRARAIDLLMKELYQRSR